MKRRSKIDKRTKWYKTMLKKHGSHEEIQRIMTERAVKGGAAVPAEKRSFYTNRELARDAGRKGK